MAGALVLEGETETLLFSCGPYIYAQVRLPHGATVLEIGAGNDPHAAAQVVVDKYIWDDAERAGRAPFVRAKPMLYTAPDGTREEFQSNLRVVCADVTDLPFADKSFDFVIAKDVLEHVPEVWKAFREISRVGKAGFVDVPKMESEWLWPQGAMHKYVFSVQDDWLVAHPIHFVSPFGRTLHDALAASAPIQQAWAQSRHYFHLARLWKGHIDVMLGEPAAVRAAHISEDYTCG